MASEEDEIGRLRRVCKESLPREILHCPRCDRPHVDGDSDANGISFAEYPHHTHRCEHCEYTWDAGRWSFGIAPSTEAAMDFGRAMSLMLRGATMSRHQWNRRDRVRMVRVGHRVSAFKSIGSHFEKWSQGSSYVDPWLPTNDDMLGEDWYTAEREPLASTLPPPGEDL